MIQFDLDVLVNGYSYTELVDLKANLIRFIDNINTMIDGDKEMDAMVTLNMIENLNSIVSNVNLIDKAMLLKGMFGFESICLN